MKLQALLLAGHSRAIDHFTELISTVCPELSLLSSIDPPTAVVSTLLRFRPEIVLLDLDSIEDSYVFGLENANLNEIFFVLVSTHKEKQQKAYRFDHFAFLPCPFCKTRFSEIIEKSKQLSPEFNTLNKNLDRFPIAVSNSFENMPVLTLAVSDGILFIPIRDIRFIKADGPYSEIHYESDKQVLIAKPLKALNARLNDLPFDRVHHSYLVNLTFVEKMHRDGYLILRNQEKVDVSRSNRQRVIKILMELNR